eukprot:GHVL01027444.1.p1 GENE.GHVL01027444.1~~GHVL01027444.1.p1  ORF type:complete len:334 (-),score=57.74 GHVL01027444.1:50-1051(-)
MFDNILFILITHFLPISAWLCWISTFIFIYMCISVNSIIRFIGIITIIIYSKYYFDKSEFRTGREWRFFSSYIFPSKYYMKILGYNIHIHPYFTKNNIKNIEKNEKNNIKNIEKNNENQYIIALHPHGVTSEYRIIFDYQFKKYFKNIKYWRTLAASVLFRIPGIRELVLWTNCVDANKNTANYILNKGYTVLVVPGGEAEQIRTEYGKEKVWLSNRKGFVKLAIQHGVPLVPCYVFGCTDLFYTSSFLLEKRIKLTKKTRICVPIFWGSPFLTPLRVQQNIVVGEPLLVDKVENPSDDHLSKVHGLYIEKLKDLFNENKEKFGYPDRELLIE